MLDRAAELNWEVVLATPVKDIPKDAKYTENAYFWELAYLQRKGYKISKDGTMMIR
jgi:hypothetical protein